MEPPFTKVTKSSESGPFCRSVCLARLSEACFCSPNCATVAKASTMFCMSGKMLRAKEEKDGWYCGSAKMHNAQNFLFRLIDATTIMFCL